jgi:hypothetical protein
MAGAYSEIVCITERYLLLRHACVGVAAGRVTGQGRQGQD